ncbi:YqhG family protein [Paenibacillus cymbidii]|uniref:YqhG family protein n=1 Tax=Paenibacillus cymbidii TaxID=1639034 RepID=UPI0010821757|nr:YqhG family protein [Paenibacillus cymbidii]
MNRIQVQQFVETYMEATDCQIIEKAPGYITVKLSPQADKDLTGRTYYWGFVERTGAPPETMTFTFVFDPERSPPPPAKRSPGAAAGAANPKPDIANADSILGRYFGVSQPAVAASRTPREEVTFGSRRLMQLFASVLAKGRFVRMYEQPVAPPTRTGAGYSASAGYHTWLAVNYVVELACDMKRSEWHSLGINLATGEMAEQFHERLQALRLSPNLPEGVHLRTSQLSLAFGTAQLETLLERKLRRYDHGWADEALDRLAAELARIEGYYDSQLQTADEQERRAIAEQFENRKREIDWQYRPKIIAKVVNCGLFHTADGLRERTDISCQGSPP